MEIIMYSFYWTEYYKYLTYHLVVAKSRQTLIHMKGVSTNKQISEMFVNTKYN